MTTTITVSEDVWTYLHRKKRPGDSFDDVLRRELLHDRADQLDDSRADVDIYSDLDFPRGVVRDDAIEAIEAAAQYLKVERQATMREIVTEISAEHPLKYGPQEVDEGERYRGAWWRRVVKKGLEAHPNVSKPDGGRRAWEWRD